MGAMQWSLMEMRMPEGGTRIRTVGARRWREVELTIDSGVCDTVMPISMRPEISIRDPESQCKRLEFEVANGETIANEER